MMCQSDYLSNILVDTGSSLNVIPKTTLARLSYKGTPMKFNDIVVRAFDGSRKSVIGVVDLPMTIGPHTFQISFQVMDVPAAYSCLLGRPWIHEEGAVTSTLHLKLKFTANGKLVTIIGEQALLISHLSNFSFITANDVEGTQFAGHPLENECTSKSRSSISSYKEAAQMVKDGNTAGWGQVIKPINNETKSGLGFAPVFPKDNQMDETLRPIRELFHSGGFLNPILQEVNVLTDDGDEDDLSRYEEWSTYLNSPEYVSQEESYAPTNQFKGMSLQQHENPPVPAEVWDTLGE